MSKVHRIQITTSRPNTTSRTNLVDAVLRAIGKPEVAPAPISPKATKVAPTPVLKSEVSNAIPVANRSLRTELTLCPICNVSVRSDRLDRHLRKVHQQANTPTSVPPTSKTANITTAKDEALCPVCNMPIKPSKLAHHLVKVHKQPMPAMSARMMNKVSGPRNQLPPRPNTNENSQAAFDQAFHEKRFGDKYVGQSRREGSGRFGSLPLYDDYGDEADAD